ncbi:MAG: DNA repair protein RadC [Gammaproteobacteria bacterium]|nr:DNA repair protein RadC [Gammaproteobacteria bacterium]
MTITAWPIDDRPRERLLRHGPEVLSDAELLAIVLRTGVSGKSAVDLGRELLARFGGFRGLLTAEAGAFCAAPGLGPAKYAMVRAVLEMGRRQLGENLRREIIFASSTATRQYLLACFRDRPREAFGCLFLDVRHRLLVQEVLFEGTLDGAAVYPREVVRRALVHNAAAIIFVHNHPSGHPEPSAADRDLTVRLAAALALVGVSVLDHLVVGDGVVVSFRERGWL